MRQDKITTKREHTTSRSPLTCTVHHTILHRYPYTLFIRLVLLNKLFCDVRITPPLLTHSSFRCNKVPSKFHPPTLTDWRGHIYTFPARFLMRTVPVVERTVQLALSATKFESACVARNRKKSALPLLPFLTVSVCTFFVFITACARTWHVRECQQSFQFPENMQGRRKYPLPFPVSFRPTYYSLASVSCPFVLAMLFVCVCHIYVAIEGVR